MASRIATYSIDGSVRYGAVTDSGIVDLSGRFGKDYPTLREVIAAGALTRISKIKSENSPVRVVLVTLLPVAAFASPLLTSRSAVSSTVMLPSGLPPSGSGITARALCATAKLASNSAMNKYLSFLFNWSNGIMGSGFLFPPR